jgi:signal transduction histidine kinase
MRSMRNLFESLGKPFVLLEGIFLVFLMGFLDYITGSDLAFSIFYLIPISIVVWYAGKYYGVFIALLSSIVWYYADTQSGRGYSSEAIGYWNALMRFGFFVIVVYLIDKLRIFNSELEEKVKIRTSDLTAEISERKKAEDELKKITEKLRLLAKRMHIIREEESTTIAREIHDELGQALTAIKIDVAWLSKRYSNDTALVDGLFTISNTIDDTIKTVRKISTRLRPRLLDELGLIPAVEWQVKEFQARTGIKVDLFVPEDNIDLTPVVSSALFRIFQEAITNVSRHSKATNLLVEINENNRGKLKMTIRDNGTGLPEDYMNKDHSLGIIGMLERASSIGGKVELNSVPEGGTEVLVKVALKHQKNNEKV